MADEIEFITITTGATRLSRRTEIPGIAVDEVRAAIAEGRRLLDTGWSVRLRHAPDGCFAYNLVYDGQPVIACYLCVDRGRSDDLWTIASLAPNLLGRSMAPSSVLTKSVTADSVRDADWRLTDSDDGDGS